eukprot:GEMP01111689.1.p2 GENE.GEMP01111689.1~~GEMP01111689.1.p2  ORF type:complete len:152 (-),score=12.80 GEMP01111689.1:45-500(-)
MAALTDLFDFDVFGSRGSSRGIHATHTMHTHGAMNRIRQHTLTDLLDFFDVFFGLQGSSCGMHLSPHALPLMQNWAHVSPSHAHPLPLLHSRCPLMHELPHAFPTVHTLQHRPPFFHATTTGSTVKKTNLSNICVHYSRGDRKLFYNAVSR